MSHGTVYIDRDVNSLVCAGLIPYEWLRDRLKGYILESFQAIKCSSGDRIQNSELIQGLVLDYKTTFMRP